MKFTLNGTNCDAPEGKATYSKLAYWAGYKEDSNVTITYRSKRNGNSGNLSAGETLEVDESMVVNVTITGNA